jgi:5-methyltetrahydrofolate--homocysteine methyltransferase
MREVVRESTEPLIKRGFLQYATWVRYKRVSSMENLLNDPFMKALHQKVLVYDGAMGTNLQKMDLSPEDFGGTRFVGCNDHLVISKPEVVEQIHKSFLDAGVDVIQTNTFRSNRLTLSEYGLEDIVHEINFTAAKLARQLADEYSTPSRLRFVAGSIGPTGKLPSADDPDLSDIHFDTLVDVFQEQARGLIAGGVNVLLIETSQDLLEVKAAIHGIQRAFFETGKRLPLQVQVTLDTSGRMLLGTDIATALTALERLPIEVIGLNCSTGPEHMREPIQYLGENATLPVSCIPNAGLPLNVDGQAVYPLEPEPFVADLVEFVEKHKISIVGGCCGTTPEHLERLVRAIGQQDHPLRPTAGTPRLASAVQAISMHQEPAPLLIGERINTQGSRKAKELLMAEDYDSIIALARSQESNGAHALDICVALTERPDEAEMMQAVVHKLSLSVETPLVIDSTEPEVMEAGLKAAPGRCILNSINLEAGREKLDSILSLAAKHASAVIALTIDEEGMAKTAERKVDIARRIYTIATEEFGLQPEDLIFDPLTFTLATGDGEFIDSAKETIEGIRRIKTELPGTFTSLGISNVSFGLTRAARPILNSVMLYHCVQAGLDMAIINPSHVKPYAEIPELERRLAEDLIFNRRADALPRLIKYFESIELSEDEETQIDPTKEMKAEERIHWRIIHRNKEGVEEDIDEILSEHPEGQRSDAAVEILNHVLLPAMKEVGDKFGAGELILPFVLQSAEVMKKAVAYLEQFLDQMQEIGKGVVILATVFGDVHDIGKNLVKTILSNNGYIVHDLGKQVPANVIIENAVELKADAIGLSALLVSTSKQMPIIVDELRRRDLKIPVLIGGAAINRRFGRRILLNEEGEPYPGGVFYCKDAFEGLTVLDTLQKPEAREQLIQEGLVEAQRELSRSRPSGAIRYRSNAVTPAIKLPKPPSWGAKVVHDMPLQSVFQCLSKNELFRLSWGAKNTRGPEWQELEAEFEGRLFQMQREALKEGWLKPQGIYGFWPAQSEGDELIVYDPQEIEANARTEIARFGFPRQRGSQNLCLADYFASVESDRMDVVAFQVVTVGHRATERFEILQSAGNYTEAYYSHGLAVQTAEAAAEYLHRHIQREMGIPAGQGKRYSWGYPAIPELEDHAKLFSLLPAEQELKMELSPAFQLIPEQSTAAIIVHHPDAKYYSVGVNRVEQLLEG